MQEITSSYSLNNKWLQHLYMQAPMAVGVYIGQDHVIEFANPRMCKVWGRTYEQVINKPLFQALPEVANRGFEEILAGVFTTGEPYAGKMLPAPLEREGRIEIAYFDILYQPLYDDNNSIIGIIQIANEVTSWVEARNIAEQNEELLKLALDSVTMGTWQIDFIKGQLHRSPEHDKVFGYQQMLPEWSYEKFLEHVLEEDRALADEKYNASFQSGDLNMEVRIRWADNSVHWILIKGKVTLDLKGKPVLASGVVMDITDQKEAAAREVQLAIEQIAHQEMERQNQMLQDLFMNAPALMATLMGEDFTFELINPLFHQLFAGRDLVGKPILEAMPELKGQPVMAMLENVYKTGVPYVGNEEPVLLDKHGNGQLEMTYFNFIYQAIKDRSGRTKGVMAFGYEVTDLVESRKKIEKSEESLRIALEAGKMGTWHLDLINDTSVRSLQHDQIFGYNTMLPQWGFKQFIEHVLPVDREEVAQRFKTAEEKGELQFEARILGADKKKRWIAVKGKAFYEDNKPVHMAGIVMDISEKKEAEEQLKELTEELAASNEELVAANEEIRSNMEELALTNDRLTQINMDLENSRRLIERSEESLRLALEAGKMGTWHLDLIDDTTTRSLQHDQIFGYKSLQSEWGFKHFIQHVLPIDQEEVAHQFKVAIATGELNFEARILTVDEQKRWIAVSGKAFYEGDKPVRMAGTVMDISERKQAEEQLKELTEELAASNEELVAANEEIRSSMEELSLTNNKLVQINSDLDNFIYTASHDLKAPISNIEGLMRIINRSISKESQENETVRKTLGMIDTSIERFKKTISELTNISKLQKENEEISLISILEVIREVQLDLDTLIRESEVDIEINASEEDEIQFSYKNLKSIVYNLLSNAIKYRSPERKAKVSITFEQKTECQVLTVEDNGLGINEKDVDKIFSMFKRLHSHVEGSGVGLYLVKRIIDNTGGKLEVKSKEGEGTTFKVFLPLVNQQVVE